MQATDNQIDLDDSRVVEEAYNAGESRRIDYLPSPGEIAHACASIRSGWTGSERRRRFIGKDLPDDPNAAWAPPVVDTSYFRLASARRYETAS
ncbi:hypothetical protein Mal64_24160 [Pseudobythopirellula maris]|uniref:Uncharacterized protein n=1 Tax=Pseudobythopirellula maris TaxID=2527991 RepID=A0A5C5ZP53_9BACT|nr:hypothetical protein [Pseudobythopirellula maris]TWT88926.1 hypothetical protein Mal64_24160 [Pseudobythopirellula maris]